MNDTLTKDDLLNMMESYKSNIEFNKQLFGSQERIVNDHSKVIDNLLQITKSQEKMAIQFKNLVDKLSEHNTACVASFTTAVVSVEKVGDRIAEHNIESIKHNSKIRNHLIAVYSVLGGVVASLIITLAKFWDKGGV